MKKIKTLILILGTLLLLVTACGNQTAPVTTNVTTPIQNPGSGKAVVTGKISSTISKKPLKIPVWLAEVHRQGDEAVYVLNAVSSPGIYADENGIFVLANITPGEYVIVVGNPEGQNEVIMDDLGKPKVWNVPADQIYDVGEFKVKLTQ